jgi:hypothetical protein
VWASLDGAHTLSEGVRAMLKARPEKFVEVIEILDKEEIKDGELIQTFKTVSLIVWVKGPGCPVPVVIDTDEIIASYEDNYPSGDESQTLSAVKFVAKARRAELLLRRDLLTTVCELAPQHADDNDIIEIANILAAEDADGTKILQKAKWYRSNVQTTTDNEDEDEDATEGEVEGVDATGQLTSLTLVESTQE